MKYFIPTIIALLLFVASCTKITTPVTSQDMMRKGKWKISSAKAVNKSFWASINSTYNDTTLFSFNSCTSDNYLVFGANYGGIVYTGTNKCNPTEPDNQAFYWELVNNGKNMNIYNADLFFGIPSVKATVSNFSQSGFTLNYNYWVAIPDPNNAHRTLNDTINITANFNNY